MDWQDFVGVTAIILIVGFCVASIALAYFSDTYNTQVSGTKYLVRCWLDEELRAIGERNDVTLQERALVQRTLLRLKQRVDSIQS